MWRAADSDFHKALQALSSKMASYCRRQNIDTRIWILKSEIRQEHDDLFAGSTTKLPFRAFLCDAPTHRKASIPIRAHRFCTGFVQEFGDFSRHRPASQCKFLQAPAQSPVNKSYFIGVCSDPDWIRTNNLLLRRGLLYSVEPRGHPFG